MTRAVAGTDATPRATGASDAGWPSIPLSRWADTRDTLHLWMQIVGKTRLALAPHVNHWWQVPLYVSARGLTTSRMPYGAGGVEVAFDFLDHVLRVDTDRGTSWTLPLEPRSVAAFYREYRAGLRSLGLAVHIWPHPVELVEAIPFEEDETHQSYDRDAVQTFWRALAQAEAALHRFRSGFVGKCSPVHFFWGSFDLACTRFSGREAPLHPGGVPHLADWAVREAYSHECISAGWWPGTVGSAVAEPAFYAYAYPEPAGCPEAPVSPGDARYVAELREWILPYESARRASDPDAAAQAFFGSTYAVAAELGGWNRAALERRGVVGAARR